MESVYSRPDMIRAVVSHFHCAGNPAIANVALGDYQFDVLVFEKSERTMLAIQCMYGGQPATLLSHFATAASHLAAAKSGALHLGTFARKPKGRKEVPPWPNASNLTSDLRFSVSVALVEKVCKRIELLRSFKRQFPEIGILRVKLNGECREYLRDRTGEKDFTVASGCSVRMHRSARDAVGEQKAK